MSYGDAMRVRGAAAGLDRARGYRRQNEQDKMAAESHELGMETGELRNEALGLRIEGDKFANERAGVQAERQDKQYQIDEKIQTASRAMKEGLLKLSVSGDPSGLISAYNTHVPDGGEIVGYEYVEPKGEEDRPKYKLKFKSGREQVLDQEQLGGFAAMLTQPEKLIEIREARRAEIEAKREKLEAEDRALADEKEIIKFRNDDDLRSREEEIKRGLVVDPNARPEAGPGGPVELTTTDSNYFKSYFGNVYGGKFEDGIFSFSDDYKDEAVEAMAIAESAYKTGEYSRAESAALGYYATGGVLSEEDARKVAEDEYKAADLDETKKEYLKARVPELIEESKWAKHEVQRKGLDRFSAMREGGGQPAQQQPQGGQGLMVDPDSELGQMLVEP